MQRKCKLPVQLPTPDIVWRDILPSNCRREMGSLNVSKAIGLAVGTATIPHSSKVQSEGKCDYFGSKCDAHNMYFYCYSFHVYFLRRGI
jgi:hypothetical protein